MNYLLLLRMIICLIILDISEKKSGKFLRMFRGKLCANLEDFKKANLELKIVLGIVIAIVLLIVGITRENIEEIFGMQNEDVVQTSITQESVSGTQEQTEAYKASYTRRCA